MVEDAVAAFEEEFVVGLNPVIQQSGDKLGVVPPIQKVEQRDNGLYKTEEFFQPDQFYDPINKIGYIGNIYVNINLLLN